MLTTPDISTEIKDILSAHDLEHIDCQFLFPPEHNMPELGIERFVKCWPKIHAFDFVQYSVSCATVRPLLSMLRRASGSSFTPIVWSTALIFPLPRIAHRIS